MTEEEARTKWCHRVERDPRDKVIVPGQRCIASDCMAWRWKTVPNPAWQPDTSMNMYPTRNPYSQVPSGVPSKTDGGCGLAGQPQ